MGPPVTAWTPFASAVASEVAAECLAACHVEIDDSLTFSAPFTEEEQEANAAKAVGGGGGAMRGSRKPPNSTTSFIKAEFVQKRCNVMNGLCAAASANRQIKGKVTARMSGTKDDPNTKRKAEAAGTQVKPRSKATPIDLSQDSDDDIAAEGSAPQPPAAVKTEEAPASAAAAVPSAAAACSRRSRC